MPYYRRNLIILWGTTFLAAASWTQVVPFLPLFLEQLGAGDQLTFWSGLVFSAQYAAGILMAPFWGKVADQRGRKLMTVRAGLFLSAIYFLTAMSTAPWHVLLYRFLNGALTGFIPSSISLIATNTPKELASKYVASVQTASATGTIIGPVIGGILSGVFGLRGGLMASGTAVFISLLFVIIFVKEPNKVSVSKKTTFREDITTAMHHVTLRKVMFVSVLSMIASVAIQPILTLYVSDMTEGTSSVLFISGLLFSLPGVAFVLTATWWVKKGSQVGYMKVIHWGLIGSGIAGAMLYFSRTIPSFAVVFFIQGIFLAALRPASSAIISDEIEENFRGRAFGMQQSAITFGGLIGPLLTGLIGTPFGHATLFFAVGLVLLLGAMYLVKAERKDTNNVKHVDDPPHRRARLPR